LTRGEPVPSEIANKLNIAQAGRVSRIAGDALMTGDGNPYANPNISQIDKAKPVNPL